MLECVANLSEGRDSRVLAALRAAAGAALLDVHRDPDHHRAVFTLGGEDGEVEAAARTLASATVSLLDLTGHDGCHPRFGVVDVVPFVGLPPSPWVSRAAVDARDRFAAWAGATLGVPSFLYGPLADGTERSLPDVRRGAFTAMAPDYGPSRPHPTAGAMAVGARGVLVAYNLWLRGGDAALARSVASAIRGPKVRALGFQLSSGVQVSCNLVDPEEIGPAEVYDATEPLLHAGGAEVDRCELVGLVPGAVLARTPRRRWRQLGLDPDATIEARLAAAGVGRAPD